MAMLTSERPDVEIADEVMEKELVEPPKMWQAVIFNDDVTPMSFVVDLLVRVFRMGKNEAYEKMMESNDTGNAVVGMYPKGIAEMKKAESDRVSRAMGFPLRVEIERCE